MKPKGDSVAPVLVFGWGNPSRGDDALGPMFVEQLSALLGEAQLSGIDCLTDFQLQVEHALDLVGRERVLFVDASQGLEAPFAVTALRASRDASFTTHAMSPEAVMQVFAQLHGREAPPCTLLAIRGEGFELGAPCSRAAEANLAQALAWSRLWLAENAATTSLRTTA